MMSSVIKYGFLGNEYVPHYEYIRKKYSVYFDLSWRLNTLSHSMLCELNGKILNDDVRLIVISTLIIKSITSFQSIIILLSKGLQKEVNILLRSFIEIFFWIKAISNSQEYHKIYILHGEQQRIRYAEDIRDYDIDMHDNIGGIAELEERIRRNKATLESLKNEYGYSDSQVTASSKPYKLAQAGGVSRIYVTVYSHLSHDVHSNSVSTNDYFAIDCNDSRVINYGPADQETEPSFRTSIGMLLQICEVMSNEFELSNYTPEIEKIHDELISISNISDAK